MAIVSNLESYMKILKTILKWILIVFGGIVVMMIPAIIDGIKHGGAVDVHYDLMPWLLGYIIVVCTLKFVSSFKNMKKVQTAPKQQKRYTREEEERMRIKRRDYIESMRDRLKEDPFEFFIQNKYEFAGMLFIEGVVTSGICEWKIRRYRVHRESKEELATNIDMMFPLADGSERLVRIGSIGCGDHIYKSEPVVIEGDDITVVLDDRSISFEDVQIGGTVRLVSIEDTNSIDV